MTYLEKSHDYYELPVLIDDPTKKRIITEVTENPAGVYSQILFCFDTEVVEASSRSIAADDDTYFRCCDLQMIGLQDAGLKRFTVYSQIPSLGTVLTNERKQKERNEYQKQWIRKKRKKHIKPVMCKQCDQFFVPKRSTAVFCSSKCRLQCHRANKSPAPSLLKDQKQK